MTDPGFEVDLFIATDLRTMTAVWMGDISQGSATAAAALEAHGPTDLRRRLNAWLGLSAFAPIKNMRMALARGFPGGVASASPASTPTGSHQTQR